MSDSFLDNAGGYTPVPDKLVKEYDFSTAYVWGVVWRYCQMEKGFCDAAHETIAERAGMSRRSLVDKLAVLVKDGYIEDLTPDLSNRPHQLCTKKGEEKIKSTMQILHSEIPECAEIAQQNGSAMQKLPSHYANFAQPAMQNLHSKKVFKETEIKREEREPTDSYGPLSLALAKVCLINLETVTRKQSQKFAEVVGTLVKVKATAAQVEGFSQWWITNWRGKNGSPPLLDQVCEVWGEYQASSIKRKVVIT